MLCSVITKKSTLHIILVILQMNQRIPLDDGPVQRQLLIVSLVPEDDVAAYWACELEFDPFFDTLCMEYMLFVTT